MHVSVFLLLFVLTHLLATVLIYMYPLAADASATRRVSWTIAKALPYGLAVAAITLTGGFGTVWSLIGLVLVGSTQFALEWLKQSGARRFIVDLLLTHLVPLLLLLAIWCSFTHNWLGLAGVFKELLQPQVLILLIAYVFILHPTSALIAQVLKPWLNHADLKDEASLKHAGKLIGFLERFLILTFVLLDQWSAIGFLLAAKSIMRFNDTRTAKRPVSEYVLLGTLLSFTFSLIVGITVFNIIPPLA